MATYFQLASGVEAIAEDGGRLEMHFPARECQLPGEAHGEALRFLVEDAVLCELANVAAELVAQPVAA